MKAHRSITFAAALLITALVFFALRSPTIAAPLEQPISAAAVGTTQVPIPTSSG